MKPVYLLLVFIFSVFTSVADVSGPGDPVAAPSQQLAFLDGEDLDDPLDDKGTRPLLDAAFWYAPSYTRLDVVLAHVFLGTLIRPAFLGAIVFAPRAPPRTC